MEWYKDQRDAARAAATDPMTKEYIERLERIARAAYPVLKASNKRQAQYNDEEYELDEALSDINYLF